MLAYHGGRRDFDRFAAPRGDHPSKIGIWFTDDRDVAAMFAERAATDVVDDRPTVFACEVSVFSPARFETYRDYLGAWSEHGSDAARLRRALMRRGHDGIVIECSDTDGGPLRRDLAAFSRDSVRVLSVERGLSVAERRRERTGQEAEREL